MVREGGIEPPRPCGHQILSLARLPIPPPTLSTVSVDVPKRDLTTKHHPPSGRAEKTIRSHHCHHNNDKIWTLERNLRNEGQAVAIKARDAPIQEFPPDSDKHSAQHLRTWSPPPIGSLPDVIPKLLESKAKMVVDTGFEPVTSCV